MVELVEAASSAQQLIRGPFLFPYEALPFCPKGGEEEGKENGKASL